MTEIMRLLRQGQLALAAIQRDRAVGGAQQPRDQAQQRSLARSVRARDGEHVAGRRLEIEVGEDLPATAHASDATSRQPHPAYSLPLLKRWGSAREFCGGALPPSLAGV